MLGGVMNPFGGGGAVSSPHPGEGRERSYDIRYHTFPGPCERSGGFEGPPGTLFSVDPSPEEDCASPRLYGAAPQLPADPQPAAPGSAMRIGLNLGVRTYFASSPDGEVMRLGTNVYRRSGGSSGVVAGGVSASMVVPPVCKARCHAEGCGADLTGAKHYHRRHKVCEFHSKAAAAVVRGLTQRFCQQCSRFHVLDEFDQGKRSCRKRLADHNRRRRKTQPPLATPAASSPGSPLHQGSSSASATAVAVNAAVAISSVLRGPSSEAPPAGNMSPRWMVAPAGSAAPATLPPLPASPTRMALGRCFFQSTEGVAGVNQSASSSSSPSSCSSSCSSSRSVLPHLADFGSFYCRVPMSTWDAGPDD